MRVLYAGAEGDALAIVPDHATIEDIQNFIKQMVCDSLECDDSRERIAGTVEYTIHCPREFTLVETPVMATAALAHEPGGIKIAVDGMAPAAASPTTPKQSPFSVEDTSKRPSIEELIPTSRKVTENDICYLRWLLGYVENDQHRKAGAEIVDALFKEI